MSKLNRFILFLMASALISCRSDSKPSLTENPEWKPGDTSSLYSFFVAGHTYGNAMNFQYGLHPPFVASIPNINAYPKLELGILTGDVVPKSTEEYWDAAESDFDLLQVPLHIAPGNHDKSEIFYSRYEDYYSFNIHNDLFLILSPVNWNIEGDQLNFLKNTVDSNKHKVNNIFIFCHELIWWSPDNEYSDIEINYRPHFPGKTNYWDSIEPFLDSLDLPVYLFAGDLGTTEAVSSWMYDKQDNISYLGSGMGSNVNDNMIFVTVLKNNEVKIQFIKKFEDELSLIKEI